MARPWTGIGHYTAELMRALFAEPRAGLEFKAFGAAARPRRAVLTALGLPRDDVRVSPIPTRLRIPLTTRLGMPQLDGYFGPLDVVHGAFHLLPASYSRRRVVTIFDLTAFLHGESKSPKSAAQQRRLITHALIHAARVITLSEGVKQDIAARFDFDAEQIDVVPGAIRMEDYGRTPEDIAAARGRYGIPEDYFIHLGTLEPRKNLPRLIEAYAQLRAKRDAPPLVLVGARGWRDAEIFEAIGQHQMAQHVIHTGYIDRADADALLCGARACLYPSLYEGFGLPVLEAMAAGTPVLTSRDSAMSEIAGEAALLVDPQCVAQIAGGLELLLDDPVAAEKRAVAGLDIARGYSWERAADLLAQVYRRAGA